MQWSADSFIRFDARIGDALLGAMMKRLIFPLLLLLLATPAMAQTCPATPTACPSPTYYNLTVGGLLSANGGLVATTGAFTTLTTTGNLTVGGIFSTASMTLTGAGTALTVTNNALIGGTLTANGGGSLAGVFSGAPTTTGIWTFRNDVVIGSTLTPPANNIELKLLGYNGNSIPLSGNQFYQYADFSNTHLTGSSTSPINLFRVNVISSFDASLTPNGLVGTSLGVVMQNGAKAAHTALVASATANGTPVSNANLVAGDFWVFAQTSSGGTTPSGPGANGYAYALNPQTVIQGGATNWLLANTSENDIAVFGTKQQVTIGGTGTTGDVVSLTFTSSSIVGSPVTVSYTVGAGNTANQITNSLMAAVNNNAALQAAYVSASSNTPGASPFFLYWPTYNTVTVSSSVTGSSTETIALGAVVPGGSVATKLGMSIVHLSTDTAHGAGGSDAAIQIGGQYFAQAAGWDSILQIGNQNGQWPLIRTGTIFQATPQTSVYGSNRAAPFLSPLAAGGVDFSKVNFSLANGYSLNMPGWSVSGTGAQSIGNTTLTTTTSGLSIDSAGFVGATPVIVAGGGGGTGTVQGNYYVGDLIYDADGGQLQVTGVNNSTGAVTSLSLLVSPFTRGASPGGAAIATTGGSGVGLTVSYTWTAASTLALQTSGGPTTVGGTLGVANLQLGYGVRSGTNAVISTQNGSTIQINPGGAGVVYVPGPGIYVDQRIVSNQVNPSTSNGLLINVAGNSGYSPTSPMYSGFRMLANLNGTLPAGSQPLANIAFIDNIDSNAVPNGLIGLLINSSLSAGHSGSSTPFVATMNTSANFSTGPCCLVIADFWAFAGNNAGGTGPTGNNAKGSMFAMNPQVVMNPGASNWVLANAQENDLSVAATSQPATLGGTFTAGDTISLTFTSPSLTGSPVTVSATVGTGNLANNVCNMLDAAVNNSTSLIKGGVSAVCQPGSSVVSLFWPLWYTMTVSKAVTGSATENRHPWSGYGRRLG